MKTIPWGLHVWWLTDGGEQNGRGNAKVLGRLDMLQGGAQELQVFSYFKGLIVVGAIGNGSLADARIPRDIRDSGQPKGKEREGY